MLIVYNNKFICVLLFHFMLILLKHPLITEDLLSQNPTKKVMLLYKKIVLIKCCK